MTMQTITVSFLSGTDHNGSRLKARTNGDTLTIPYPHEIKESDSHLYCAMLLAKKLNWNYQFAEGTLPNGNHIFVPVTDTTLCTIDYLTTV